MERVHWCIDDTPVRNVWSRLKMMIIMTVIYFGCVHLNKNLKQAMAFLSIHPLGYLVYPMPGVCLYHFWFGLVWLCFCLKSHKKRHTYTHTSKHIKYGHKCLEWAWLCDVFLLESSCSMQIYHEFASKYLLHITLFPLFIRISCCCFFLACLVGWRCFFPAYSFTSPIYLLQSALLHYAWFYSKSFQPSYILYTHNLCNVALKSSTQKWKKWHWLKYTYKKKTQATENILPTKIYYEYKFI